MRPLRCLIPGQLWSSTSRCVNGEFRLRPDPERTQLVGYWLARALEACPGIRLFSFVQMSNHIHLELQDTCSELSVFMARFLGPLAKDLNFLDGRRGQVFERRFDPLPVLDPDAMRERIAYTLLNPVRAQLVQQYEDWEGVCLWAGHPNGTHHTFRRFRARAYHWACVCREVPPDPAEFTQEASLRVHAFNPVPVAEILEAVRQGEAEVSGAPIGMEVCSMVDPLSAPQQAPRGRRPLCHTSQATLWYAFLDAWRALTRAYRQASAAFRSGKFGTEFPLYTFRPSVPILA